MIVQMNTIAQLWWQWMGGMFWQVSLLILLVSVIDMAIRRWAWPQVRYVLWGLIFIKLVIPPTWQMPTSIVSWIQPLIEKRISIQIEPQEEMAAIDLEMDIDAPSLDPVHVSDLSGRISLKSVLLLSWMIGMVAFGFILVRKMFQLHKRYRFQDSERDSEMEIPEWFRALLAETATRLNLKKSPDVVFSRDAVSPAVYGLLRTVLLLSERFFNRLSREEAEHVLIHELCHLKRGDLWVHWFCLVLQMVYWFNPLLIWTRRRMRHLCEICCDMSVANILREKTRHYRDTLIRTARDLFTDTVESGLGLLGVFEEPFRIVPRLQWLEKKTWENRKRKTLTAFITSAAMFAFVMPMAGLSQTEAQNEKPSVQNDLQPVKWSANEVSYDTILNSVFLTGKVIISDELITITANNAAVRIKENFKADKQPSPESIKNIELNGNVRIESKMGTASSEKAVYDRETNKLILSGRVQLIKDSNTISGDIVGIDLGTGNFSVNGVEAVLSPVQPADGVYEAANVDEQPRLTRAFPPKYPDVAKEENIRGRIVVALVVTKDGTLKDPWVIDAEPPDIFEEAALEAVMGYQFTPGMRNGEAVDVKVKVPIHFIPGEPDKEFLLDPEAKDPTGNKYNMNEVNQPPRVVKVPKPEYPLIAREEKIEGRVLLRIVVDTDGTAQEPEVVEATPAGIFEEAALDVVNRYRFKPAIKDGKPVACIVKIPIDFNFKNDGVYHITAFSGK